MYKLIRPLLFSLDPERAHDLTMSSLGLAGNSGLAGRLMPARVEDPLELLGLQFPNRVGLSAGLDKNGTAIRGMASLGFGFLEVGTVTPKPQSGNLKPRMFRLVEQQAIINRMGFNNNGLDALITRVKAVRQSGIDCPLGINIGKNKLTSAAGAVNDYLQCITAVAPLADYITINLSSPNTPGLRDLQFGDELAALLAQVTQARSEFAEREGKRVPLLVKIAPDMADTDLLNVADQLIEQGIDGIIATNTTIDKRLVEGHPYGHQAGGLSGQVLFERSTEVVAKLADHIDGQIAIIGVGGIHSGEQAAAKIAAGADLVQIYSGLIYQGPRLVRDAATAIRLARQEP
ncbi:MAG: quinone-dependent dihydroorotate dehydrogenase [Pseudomonadales bacterium]|nr:quinone-dependent dihydroorotate dehydrogenase [Pseudomonadales bacterium]